MASTSSPRWPLERMTGFLLRAGIDPDTGERIVSSGQPPTIKPGRCECKDRSCPCRPLMSHLSGSVEWCLNDAVRLVTVRKTFPEPHERPRGSQDEPHIYERSVPMCSACADYHEKAVQS